MPSRILIVDDTATVRVFLRRHLERNGFATEEATNGEEALQRVATAPPDLVIMDRIMPVMDGVECCRRLRKEPTTRELPIIIVSSSEEHAGGRADGADWNDEVRKPVRISELLAKMRRLLKS